MYRTALSCVHLYIALRGIAVAPNNTVSRVGEKFFLKCGTNDESKVRKWTHYSTNRSTVSIYKHPDVFHPNFTHFDIQVDINGSEVLYTNSTRSEDAGIYGCSTKVDGKDETFTAHVVVLGKCYISLGRGLFNFTRATSYFIRPDKVIQYRGILY